MTPSYTLPRSHRIGRRRELDRAFAERCRTSDSRLLVYVHPNGLGHARVAIIVGRRHGNAVHRNRLKRLMREAFRVCQHDLAGGYDYVCVPKPQPDHTVDLLRASLGRLADHAVAKYARRSGADEFLS